jgi:hypothetical protein
MSVDTTGRLKVGQPLNLFDYIPSALDTEDNIDTWVNVYYSDNPTVATDDPTVSNNSTTNSVDLTLRSSSTSSYQIVTRESKRLMLYQPGKTRTLILGVCPFISQVSNPIVNTNGGSIFSRVGIFTTDDNIVPAINYQKKTPLDGFYFEVNIDGFGSKTLKWCYSYNSTVTSISQSSWNVDVFDGDGPSGKTLTGSSMEQTILCVIEQECGIGRVRVGFRIDGITYWAHQFTKSATTAFQIAHSNIKSPLAPIMYQLGCDNTTLSNDVIQRQLYCSCISEGSNIICGNPVNYSTASSTIDGKALNDTNRRIVMAVKINSTYNNCYAQLLSFSGLYYSTSGYNNDQNIIIEVYIHSSYDKSSFNGSYSIGTLDDTEQNFVGISNSILTGYIGDDATDRYVNNDGYKIGTFFMDKTGIKHDFILNNHNLTKLEISKYDTIYFTARTTYATDNDIYLSLSVDFNQYI